MAYHYNIKSWIVVIIIIIIINHMDDFDFSPFHKDTQQQKMIELYRFKKKVY